MILLDTLVTTSIREIKLPHLGVNASLTIEKKFDPLHEFWIKNAQEVLMAMPSSGELKFSQLRTELGLSNPISLRTASSNAGKSIPDSLSEFYGYSPIVTVYWYQPVKTGGSGTLTGNREFRLGAGTWTSFTGTKTDTNVTASTVGYRYTVQFVGSPGGADVKCGPTQGSLTYGSYSNSAAANTTQTFTLDGVTTSGRPAMHFTGAYS